MKIHKEGFGTIVLITFILLTINGTFHHFIHNNILFSAVLISSLIIYYITINFFRNPKRIFGGNRRGTVVAPADGTIVVIEEVFEEDFFNEKRIQVSIFMNLFNVHINWVPSDGKVIHASHQDGRFMAAYLPKSSKENERSSIVIETPEGRRILIRQIAGAMAKRIVTYVKEGKGCNIDQQLGFIKFGSRVDLFLPVDSEIKVKVGEKVKGNINVIAKIGS